MGSEQKLLAAKTPELANSRAGRMGPKGGAAVNGSVRGQSKAQRKKAQGAPGQTVLELDLTKAEERSGRIEGFRIVGPDDSAKSGPIPELLERGSRIVG